MTPDMPTREEHLSPDGMLRLLILREAGDITIGFDGFPWHTHGDVIAGELCLLGEPISTPESAAARFVEDVLLGRIAIGVVRVGGQVRDVFATYLLKTEDPYRPEDEELELRRWDGTPWEAG